MSHLLVDSRCGYQATEAKSEIVETESAPEGTNPKEIETRRHHTNTADQWVGNFFAPDDKFDINKLKLPEDYIPPSE